MGHCTQDVLRDNLEPAVALLADTLIDPQVTLGEIEEQKAVRTHQARAEKKDHELSFVLQYLRDAFLEPGRLVTMTHFERAKE